MGALLSCVRGKTAHRQSVFYRAYSINDELGQRLLSVGIGKTQLFHLHEIFSAMDRDRSGEISLIEFFNYIDIKRTRFSEKAFSVMDRDGSGEVDFIEFVLAVWNYCSFSKASLVRYSFDLYDLDGSGEIERDEASRCVREIWGDDWEHNQNAQKVMAKLDAVMQITPHERLTMHMFQDFTQRHPILLFPAFQLQTEIQQRVLGERFWRKAAAQRASVDPRDLNWRNFDKMTKVSRQNSENFLQTIDTTCEADLAADTHADPSRRRSSLHDMFSKVRGHGNKKVFLGDDEANGGGNSGTNLTVPSPATETQVTVLQTSAPSPTAKKHKNASHRPPSIDTTASSPGSQHTELSSPTRSRSVTPSATPSPQHAGTPTPSSSPTKKKKKRRKPASDLVVEDVSGGGGGSVNLG